MLGPIDKARGARGALLALGLVALALASFAQPASAGPRATRVVQAAGTIVPIPSAIPHQEGGMIDRRIVPDLRWIAQRFPIYVTEGYSGPLPGGGRAGCRGCHVRRSDHYNGLAVDIVPLRSSGRCDRSWRGITRLARWAEPRPNRPLSPFRWVGYDRDAGHGCGHHLHLSWEHAPARHFQLAEWVEVFRAKGRDLAPPPRPPRDGAQGGAEVEGQPEEPVSQPPSEGPRGGISRVQTGGVSPRGN